MARTTPHSNAYVQEETVYEVSPPSKWNIIEILGWVGTLLYGVAYWLNAHQFIDNGVTFVLLNTIAAVFVGLVSLKQGAKQSLLIQVMWVGIGMSALIVHGG